MVPITTAQAQLEVFAIRRRTIGIIEPLATVVVKSRTESQVTEQHVKDGQLDRPAVSGDRRALRLFGMDLSLIAVVGLLMLIGIVKKNAIMMIDVALVTQREGKAPADAIYEAALLRFRPIMMTKLAALLGVLPIAAGFGAGAELRQPLGVALVGGLLVSQVLKLYMTPTLYIYMERLADGARHLRRKFSRRTNDEIRQAGG